MLTGERGHYEVAAGNFSYAEKLLKTMENYANETGLFPEQVWDSDDVPELGLYYGKPTGAAMPLAWAHSEYIKLSRSIRAKRVFDMPAQVEQRYQIEKKTSNVFIWNFNSKYKFIPKGSVLRIHALACATVKWSTDNWETSNEIVTLDSGIGVFYADLNTNALDFGKEFSFTFYWHEAGTWEDKAFTLSIENSREEKKVAEEAPVLPDRDKLKVFLPS